MNPQITPLFENLCARLREVSWFANVGQCTTLTLPYSYRFVRDASDAVGLIAQPEWEDWTLEQHNAMTSFLNSRFQNRYTGQWNKIAKIAKSFLLNELEPSFRRALEDALPDSAASLGPVRWDLLSALMEAAYADCRPPLFFTHLVGVYEAGHLPVGWDSISVPNILLVY